MVAVAVVAEAVIAVYQRDFCILARSLYIGKILVAVYWQDPCSSISARSLQQYIGKILVAVVAVVVVAEAVVVVYWQDLCSCSRCSSVVWRSVQQLRKMKFKLSAFRIGSGIPDQILNVLSKYAYISGNRVDMNLRIYVWSLTGCRKLHRNFQIHSTIICSCALVTNRHIYRQYVITTCHSYSQKYSVALQLAKRQPNLLVVAYIAQLQPNLLCGIQHSRSQTRCVVSDIAVAKLAPQYQTQP